MGEPVEVSPENRAKTRELAARIVQSVIDDERMPLGVIEFDVHATGACVLLEDCRSIAMQLAQEIVALTEERRAFTGAFAFSKTPTDSE